MELNISKQPTWSVEKNGIVLIKGHPADVRELLEDLVEEEIGIWLSMQEDEETGEIYLHSEYDEDLTDEQIETVSELGFDDNPEGPTFSTIEKILGVNIKTNL